MKFLQRVRFNHEWFASIEELYEANTTTKNIYDTYRVQRDRILLKSSHIWFPWIHLGSNWNYLIQRDYIKLSRANINLALCHQPITERNHSVVTFKAFFKKILRCSKLSFKLAQSTSPLTKFVVTNVWFFEQFSAAWQRFGVCWYSNLQLRIWRHSNVNRAVVTNSNSRDHIIRMTSWEWAGYVVEDCSELKKQEHIQPCPSASDFQL